MKKKTKKKPKKISGYPELVSILEKFNPSEQVNLRCTFGKKELIEVGYGGGTYTLTDESGESFEYDYRLKYSTNWRFGTLVSDGYAFTVGDLIEIFKKKRISECSSKVFGGLVLENTEDGSNEYQLKWSGRIKKDHKDLLPSDNDLFWEMEIFDSEYTFNAIDEMVLSIEIDVDTTWTYTITDENKN